MVRSGPGAQNTETSGVFPLSYTPTEVGQNPIPYPSSVAQVTGPMVPVTELATSLGTQVCRLGCVWVWTPRRGLRPLGCRPKATSLAGTPNRPSHFRISVAKLSHNRQNNQNCFCFKPELFQVHSFPLHPSASTPLPAVDLTLLAPRSLGRGGPGAW